MAGRKLVECSFLIPVRRDKHLSDGRTHSSKTWTWLKRQIDMRFEGATVSSQLYFGWYRDSETGQQVIDESVKYFVAVPRSRLRELRQMLEEACREFKQKCIYLSVAGAVEFIVAGQYETE